MFRQLLLDILHRCLDDEGIWERHIITELWYGGFVVFREPAPFLGIAG
jgi:hypothetical protein